MKRASLFLMLRGLLSVISLSTTTGCSDVPTSFSVDSGVFPLNQDDEVRFRTTYYLRVFDICSVDDGKKDDNGSNAYTPRMEALTSRQSGSLHLVKDSLFRFRMTGQASALFSNVHFESGVLGADEIDPFGKTVDYDNANRKFAKFNAALQNAGAAKADKNTSTDKCPDGEPVDRRFYLLGPEGNRELNPNERLIMAMYTDAKPLISSLKLLSGQRSKTDAEQLLPFDLELNKTRADRALAILHDKDLTKDPMGPSPKAVGDRLLPLFEKDGLQ